MEPGPLKLKIKMKREQSFERNSIACQSQNILDGEHNNRSNSEFTSIFDTTPQNPLDVSVGRREDNGTETEDDQPSENADKQLVLYEPPVKSAGEIIPAPLRSESPSSRRRSFPDNTSRVLPSVGAFTVQCANCFKWRLIPTKEKYEEIREHILQQPFLCEAAREWRPSISCDDEPDIVQDGSRLWAIDKPNIAQPPPGWQRLLRIRAEGGSKFADVYYESPRGKRFRSMVEIQKYLLEHPEYVEAGVTMSQFSFQIPRPLQENYVRKKQRPIGAATLLEDNDGGMRRFNEPAEVHPLAWASPDENTDLHLAQGHPYYEAHISESAKQSAKKRRKTTKTVWNDELVDSTSHVTMEETLRL